LEIVYLKSINSTHTYLKEYIQKYGYKNPLAIVTSEQTKGLGSRNNQWVGLKGNLFFSFVVDKSLLSDDIPNQSYSIYFSFLLKEILEKKGSKVWLKWPNDFYIDDNKIGGTITNMKGDLLFCGIGLNLINIDATYYSLDISVHREELLQEYFFSVLRRNSWKQLFSKFSIEFEKSQAYKATIKDKKVSLQNAVLHSDGSIFIDNKKVFSLR